MDSFIFDSQTIDDRLAAEAGDFEKVLEGGLVMGVSKGVVEALRGIPPGR